MIVENLKSCRIYLHPSGLKPGFCLQTLGETLQAGHGSPRCAGAVAYLASNQPALGQTLQAGHGSPRCARWHSWP